MLPYLAFVVLKEDAVVLARLLTGYPDTLSRKIMKVVDIKFTNYREQVIFTFPSLNLSSSKNFLDASVGGLRCSGGLVIVSIDLA